jgi:hypothetical protein
MYELPRCTSKALCRTKINTCYENAVYTRCYNKSTSSTIRGHYLIQHTNLELLQWAFVAQIDSTATNPCLLPQLAGRAEDSLLTLTEIVVFLGKVVVLLLQLRALFSDVVTLLLQNFKVCQRLSLIFFGRLDIPVVARTVLDGGRRVWCRRAS